MSSCSKTHKYILLNTDLAYLPPVVAIIEKENSVKSVLRINMIYDTRF